MKLLQAVQAVGKKRSFLAAKPTRGLTELRIEATSPDAEDESAAALEEFRR